MSIITYFRFLKIVMQTNSILMKNLFFTLVFLVVPFFLLSQTYISPIIGVDLSKINSTPRAVIHIISEPFWESESLIFGLSVEQSITSKISINLEPAYTRKKAGGSFRGVVGYEGIIFDDYRITLQTKYRPKNYFQIGFGGNITLVDNFRRFRQERKFEELLSMKRTYSLVSSIGFSCKNINLNFSYFKGFTAIDPFGLNQLRPINSLTATLGKNEYILKTKKSVLINR